LLLATELALDRPLGSKRSYALKWRKPNNDEDEHNSWQKTLPESNTLTQQTSNKQHMPTVYDSESKYGEYGEPKSHNLRIYTAE